MGRWLRASAACAVAALLAGGLVYWLVPITQPWIDCVCGCAGRMAPARCWASERVSADDAVVAAVDASTSRRRESTGPLGRLLVILAGSLRGSPSTWASLYRELIRPNRADTMLVLSATLLAELRSHPHGGAARNESARARRIAHARHWLLDRARHVVEVPEFADWGDALDLMHAQAQRDAGVARPSAPSWREHAAALPCPSDVSWGGVRNFRCRAEGARATAERASFSSGAIVATYRWYAKRAIIERRLLGRCGRHVYIMRTSAWHADARPPLRVGTTSTCTPGSRRRWAARCCCRRCRRPPTRAHAASLSCRTTSLSTSQRRRSQTRLPIPRSVRSMHPHCRAAV